MDSRRRPSYRRPPLRVIGVADRTVLTTFGLIARVSMSDQDNVLIVYPRRISRRARMRSVSGRIPSSWVMTSASSCSVMAFS
jgi:hypothetical protein